MASAASLTAGVAGRYATALFELAQEKKAIDRVEADLLALEAALNASPELRDAISSPVYSRAEQGAALAAVAKKMGLGPEVSNTLGVMAANRRLFVLPGTIAAVKGMIAEARGEVTAEVTAARPLSDAQLEALAETLRETFGKEVKIALTVDESLIGGLVVKVGSRMIDDSIRAKLARMQHVMKEAG